ncbi:MAG: segregation/condensation protein A [Sutterellaceae bacterium]|nr:segregation/condensation protein A [Sutterellaceae bacterium]MDD7441068.1 segregation/condensation protein A [Sutterellaceae bacterium]MDY2868944.1 segregation/condensation protein A [Mesosutterella sp.]
MEEPTPRQAAPVALLYGKRVDAIPNGLYIPPDALKVFLKSFEGPLDLLLWLIQKQKFDIMDIPMTLLTEQYMQYVELIRKSNLDLAGDYLVMAAYLMSIKSRMLLPVREADTGEEVEDPKAELMRRLAEYQRMKAAAEELDRLPISGRDYSPVDVRVEEGAQALPEASLEELQAAWRAVLARVKFEERHTVTREELSVREHMTEILRKLQESDFIEFTAAFGPEPTFGHALAFYLAILELAKEEMIHITQPAPFAPIWLTRSRAKDSLI